MFCHGKDLQRQTFFSISEDRYYTRIIPAMRDKVIHYSSNGCLVMKDNDFKNNFFLDLVSMELIQLPPVEFDYQVCILWKNSRDSNCRIWFINNDFSMSCQPGDREYVKKEIQFEDEEEEEDYGNEEFDINDKKLLDEDTEDGRKEDHVDDHSEDEEFQNEEDLEDEEFEDDEEDLEDEEYEDDEEDIEDVDNIEKSIRTAIVIENKMYAILLGSFRLVVGELEDSKIRFRKLTKKKPLPLLGPPGIICHSTYLIESHKEFFLVLMIYSNPFLSYQEVTNFEVFRFDSSIHEWVETQSIGERSIFLNYRGGRCCDAMESRVKANSIYFFKSQDRHLYVFDIKDRSITISLPCSNVSNNYSLIYWI